MPLSAPPIRTPVVDKNGSATFPWVKWWQQAQQEINAPIGQVLQVTQANLPTNWGAENAGETVYVTNYAHLLIWTGSGWMWGPGEIGSGYVMDFLQGQAPGAGWHACDGSVVNQLNANGTLTQVQLPQAGQGGSFGSLRRYFRQ
jgi:hypothetical protein